MKLGKTFDENCSLLAGNVDDVDTAQWKINFRTDHDAAIFAVVQFDSTFGSNRVTTENDIIFIRTNELKRAPLAGDTNPTPSKQFVFCFVERNS